MHPDFSEAPPFDLRKPGYVVGKVELTPISQ